MPDFPAPAEFELSDPLHDVTRKERRFLLGLSFVAVILVETGAFPKEVTALGLKLSSADQIIFIKWFLILIIYATIVFVVYGIADLISWYTQWKTRKKGILQPIGVVNQELKYEVKPWIPENKFIATLVFRFTVDLGFPFLSGVYAIYRLSNTLAKGLH
jgi:hypothetical protein